MNKIKKRKEIENEVEALAENFKYSVNINFINFLQYIERKIEL